MPNPIDLMIDPVTALLNRCEAILEGDPTLEEIAAAKATLEGMFAVWESQAQAGLVIPRHPDFKRHWRLSLSITEAGY